MQEVLPTAVSAGFIPSNDTQQKVPVLYKPRFFFVVMSLLFVLIGIIGFAPSYQAMKAGTLKPMWLVHVHGAVMTSWLLTFITQTIFAASGNIKHHKKLGILSVGLGVLVLIVMTSVSAHALIANHPPKDDFLFDLLLMEFYAIAAFGLLFTLGILARKKDAAAHKRLLMLATMVLLQAAIDRIHWLPLFGLGYPYIFFIYLDTLLIPLFIYDFITFRRIHRITLIGAAYIIALQLTVSALWGSPAWHEFWFNATAPLMEKVVEVKLTHSQTNALLGSYEGEPVGKMTIISDSGKIYMLAPGQEKMELGASSETELFLKTVSVRFSFVKTADGMVREAIFHQGSSQFKMPKLKQP